MTHLKLGARGARKEGTLSFQTTISGGTCCAGDEQCEHERYEEDEQIFFLGAWLAIGIAIDRLKVIIDL